MLKGLKLSHQLLLLVLTPLILELGFIYWLYSAFSDMERKAEQAEDARQIATHINKFMRGAMAIAAKNRFAAANKEFLGSDEELIRECHQELRLLYTYTEKDPEERKLLDSVNASLEEGIKQGEEIRSCIAKRDLDTAVRLRKELPSLLHETMQTLEAFRKEAARLEDFAPHIVQQRRDLISQALTIGISLNVLIALALALVTNRSLVKRLSILADNAKAVELNLPLKPSPGGRDEIAQLDKSFREMASGLATARAYEQRETQRLLQIVHGLPLGLALVDENGTIAMTNKTFSQMMGRQENELVDCKIGSLFEPPLDFEQLRQRSQMEAPRSDGTKFPVELASASIETREGTRWLMLIVDITERHQLNMMKQQFVAVVSHELRTPLTNVGMFLDMIDRGQYGRLDETGMNVLAGVQGGVDRLIKLTKDLMDVERLEAGVLKLDIACVPVDDCIEDAMKTVSPQAQAKNITITTNSQTGLETDQCQVQADRERLVQVLVNLLSNAIKFCPPNSGVSIHSTKDETMLRLEISDSGPGIPPELHEKIFDRFQQVNLDDSKKLGGAGLGLAICKSIIEQHGGKIGVASEPGSGAKFWFTLPLSASAND